MSDTEEQKLCQACTDFEPQTWRKSLCKNCFHTLDEHSAELLANEAKAVAKEKAATESSSKSTTAPSEQSDGKRVVDSKISPVAATKEVKDKDESQIATSENDTTKKVKRKYGAERCSGEAESSWSWAKDLGKGYGIASKPTGQDASKTTKGAATTNAQLSSSKAPPSTSTKPSSSTTATMSDTSSSSSTTTTTTSSSSDATTTASLSKAKNFASKFEAKASALTKPPSKPASKPPDIRPGMSNVAALTGKLTDSVPDSKTQSKPFPEKLNEAKKPPDVRPGMSDIAALKGKLTDNTPDSKTQSKTFPEKVNEAKKPPPQKIDSKSPKKIPEEGTAAESASTDSKTSINKLKDDIKIPGSKTISDASKEKQSTATSSKSEDKSSKFALGGSSKTAPFGKDILKSTKEATKREKATIDSAENKSISAQTKVEEKRKEPLKKSGDTTSSNDKVQADVKEAIATATAVSTNSSVDKSSNNSGNNATVSTVSSVRDSGLAGTGKVNKPGQQAKSTGRISDSQTSNGSGSKEGPAETKDSGGITSKYQAEAQSSLSKSRDVDAEEVAVLKNREKEQREGVEDQQRNITSLSSSHSSRSEAGALATSTTSEIPTASSTDSTSSPLISHPKTTPEYTITETDLDIKKSVEGSPEKSTRVEKLNDIRNNNEIVVPSTRSAVSSNEDDIRNTTDATDDVSTDSKTNIEKLNEELKAKDKQISVLIKQLSNMEEQVKSLEEDREHQKRVSVQSQKDDMEKLLNDLRVQLTRMEEQCCRLEKDNQSLIDKLRVQEASVKRDQECRGKNSDNVVLEEDLEAAEKELEDVKDENKELQRLIMEMKNEMDEMYDHFRENEHDEFREIQKELDMTAKNCRILQFKLRKAERRNEQIEHDRVQYEDKLRMLQDQFDSQDAKNHIRVLEDELRMAKEVSVRLHDELDLVEDKRNKALEENRHLTELLEHTDKRQFRMEMEIDKLRDIVADLKQQLKEAKSGSNNNKETTPDRKVLSSIYTRSID